MEQDRTESCASPLDEVLENLPQEDPPEGLEQRCLDALDEAAAQARPAHPRWWAPVRNVVAVAAGLLLIVGTANLVMNARPRVGDERERTVTALSEATSPSEAVSEEWAAEMPAQDQATPTQPVPPPAAPGGSGARFGDELAPMPAPESAMLRLEETMGVPPVGGGARFEAEQPAPGVMDAVSPRAPRTSTAYAPQHSAPEVEDPWRDFSGERQVITQKEMEIEVADVERAYDEARSIVEKHGGFVASDRIAIDEGERDVAHLTIRLPVGSFESAITDLRQLGEVVRLVGQSVDVTEEYYTEGAQVREIADREQALVEKYEAETNAARKRRLKQQLDRLREELRREKEILTNLAEQTHWPVLELVLSESTGPGGFFGRTLSGSLNALAWVGATAIIWVPLVVLLTLFWRRIVPAAPRSE